jgi:hypothetical protein
MLYSTYVVLAMLLAKTTFLSGSVTQSTGGKNGPPQTSVNRSEISKNITQKLILNTSPLHEQHLGKTSANKN